MWAVSRVGIDFRLDLLIEDSRKTGNLSVIIPHLIHPTGEIFKSSYLRCASALRPRLATDVWFVVMISSAKLLFAYVTFKYRHVSLLVRFVRQPGTALALSISIHALPILFVQLASLGCCGFLTA